MWPAVLIGVITIGLSVYAVVASWQAGAQVDANTASIVDADALRCQREEIWIKSAPQTPIEVAVRRHMIETHVPCS